MTSWPANPRDSSLAWNRTRSSTKTTSSTSSSVSSRSRAGSGSPRPIVKSGTPLRAANSAALASASPSVVWPSVSRRIAEGGTPRSSVRTWRTPSPSRDLAAVGLDLAAASRRPARRPRACRPRPAAGRPSRRGRAGPCAASGARARIRAVVLRQPALRDREPGRPRRCPAFWASSGGRRADLAGSAYWSTTCPLAESSTMTTKYGRPVRSTESTASESMNTASSTRMIRSAARPIL